MYSKYTNRVGDSLLDYYRKMIADKRLTPPPSGSLVILAGVPVTSPGETMFLK